MASNFYISAAHKSSGKTIISLGLCRAISNLNSKVQSFKKGPDYIDPIWLAKASHQPCYNLDFFNMSSEEILDLYNNHSATSDVSIIEGNKGLFDGMSVDGGDANADLAKLLNLPVILVIDTNGMTRGIAPLLQGYQNFDHGVNIQGVILNKVGGDRHESKLINAIEHYTDLKVYGSVQRNKELDIDERHLGLIPANEDDKSEIKINRISEIIADSINIKKILIDTPNNTIAKSKPRESIPSSLTIAIPRDAAFGFYYQDDLALFEKLGAKISYFDAIRDSKLPECDGLFIGGGFPEMSLKELSSNKSLLTDIQNKINAGLPAYAECGGLMYLTNNIEYLDRSFPMVGVINANTVMTQRPVGRGYVEIEPTDSHPWKDVSRKISAHEFHYSRLENIATDYEYAYNVLRGEGINNKKDGIITKNLLATYSHLRSVGGNLWVQQFIEFIKTLKEKR
ncbi:cobyrinate a,c-diamide synthase [Gammaproteobacteria bacterium]|nr:cobyrinate a,c-diamide synthase [Gammaproteobacteria bacterium]